ncbi:hypothetical protein CEXT_139821 [Caerostris extrusa]|uniref:Uncharacterized protein n=1 Tax=Caerostris extrusa TaxID=172846 RepID=A0AAV4X367_CAEEX|nr:hypothetical protein CEXT_139821 [Caerostris extrusa]
MDVTLPPPPLSSPLLHSPRGRSDVYYSRDFSGRHPRLQLSSCPGQIYIGPLKMAEETKPALWNLRPAAVFIWRMIYALLHRDLLICMSSRKKPSLILDTTWLVEALFSSNSSWICSIPSISSHSPYI